MSATNLTKNLKLPQFLASDKPSWLGDVNGAMLNIDNGYGTLNGDISKANDTASSAKSQSDANTQTLVNVNSELESQGNRITALEAGGGTEQLEQRVNTLSTDVETLQTRADTFEEEIAENGKKITALTGRVTTLETTTKTNSDNITSLQTTTEGLTISTQAIGETANTAKTTANTANGTANNALQLASTANNQSQNNSLAISNINAKIENLNALNIAVVSNNYSTSISNTHCGSALFIGRQDINTVYAIVQVFSYSSQITTDEKYLGSYNLTNVLQDVSDKTIIANDASFQVNGINLTMTAKKTTGSNEVSFYIKASSTSSTQSINVTVPISFVLA